MNYFDYSEFEIEIREDLPATYAAYWTQLAKPGNWWTGAQRVAIAEETRNALTCASVSYTHLTVPTTVIV